MERLLTKHHVKVTVAMGEHKLSLHTGNSAVFGIVWDTHEVDEGRQDRYGVGVSLQQARDNGGLVDAEEPGSFIDSRRCLLATSRPTACDAPPFGKLRLDAPDRCDEVR